MNGLNVRSHIPWDLDESLIQWNKTRNVEGILGPVENAKVAALFGGLLGDMICSRHILANFEAQED